MVSAVIAPPAPEIVYRHALAVRITHWVNAFCLFVLLLSGLQIFNAHPTLYFGEKSTPERAVLSMNAVQRADGSYAGITDDRLDAVRHDRRARAVARRDGELDGRGFPSWITLPVLPRPRHRAALAFLLRLAVRAQRPRLSRLCGLRAATFAATSHRRGPQLRAHRRSRSGSTSASASRRARRRSATTCCRSSPTSPSSSCCCRSSMLTGLTMSPGMDAAFPFLLDVFGGRQSARTIHFIVRHGHHAVRHRARGHGVRLGRLEQHPLDDHRPLRDRAEEGPMADARSPRAAAASSAAVPRVGGAALLGGCDRFRNRPRSATCSQPPRASPSACSACCCRNARSPASSPRPIYRALQGERLDQRRSMPPTSNLAQGGFADWRLEIDGLVERPPR